MENREMTTLANLTLAPWIQKSTALIGKARRVGGNQFRHMMSTLAILIDYNYFDPVLLKASLIHDLIEDVPETNIDELKKIDSDSNEVVLLVLEVSRRVWETKKEYLKRLRDFGSTNAKILKVADRISNVTDLHRTIFNAGDYKDYLEETKEYVIPMAKEVNINMAIELNDLLLKRIKKK